MGGTFRFVAGSALLLQASFAVAINVASITPTGWTQTTGQPMSNVHLLEDLFEYKSYGASSTSHPDHHGRASTAAVAA